MIVRPGIEVADDALSRVCARYKVRSLALFGSSARGDYHQGSDVDVLVEFAPGAQVGLLALGALQRELSGLVGARVDLVPVGGLHPGLRQQVLAEARPLYAA